MTRQREWELIGSVGTEVAHLIIRETSDAEWHEPARDIKGGLLRGYAQLPGERLIVSTGGDGAFDVYVQRLPDGQIAAVKIVFYSEEVDRGG